MPEQLRPRELASGRRPAAGHAQQGTPEAVRAALAWIPNADLDYDSWVRIGMAIKGAIGEAGADLFAAWSAQSAKNDAAFTAKTWAGFKPKSIGAGTLYHHAIERGWKPDAALVLDGSAPRDRRASGGGVVGRRSGDRARCRAGLELRRARVRPRHSRRRARRSHRAT